jgi:hypothetical protein
MDPTFYTPVSTMQRLSPELESAFKARDYAKVHSLSFGEMATAKLRESVGAHAFNTVTTSDVGGRAATDLYSSLFLWPIILDPQIIKNGKEGAPAIPEKLAAWVAHRMQDWTDYTSTLCLLENLFSYDFIAGGGPLKFRHMLEQMATRSLIQDEPGSDAMDDLEVEVPEGAPRLYFLMGTLSRIGEWPVLRNAGHHKTYSLARALEGALRVQLCGSRDSFGRDLNVGIPEFLDIGIASGILGWMTLLNEMYPFRGWSVETFGTDLIELCIHLDDDQTSFVRLPVCKHQLGENGLARILDYAAGLAGNLSVRSVH